jgi:hypothetical protein
MAAMYPDCLFCSAPFGSNDAIEGLQVGRRLAFDSTRGRLWVVCRQCGRWNLTPLEDRWEPLEQCERSFRATRVRTSSTNIGLARLDDGAELIRIGAPLRNEFAAWRYGSRFLRRHRQRALSTVRNAGLLAAAPVAALMLGPAGALACAGAAAVAAANLWRRPALRIGFERGEELLLSLHHLVRSRLIRDDESPEGWALVVGHLKERRSLRSIRIGRRFQEGTVTLTGAEARMAATLILPTLNAGGGNDTDVTEAVRWLEVAGGPERAIGTFARSGLVRPPLVSQLEPVSSMHPEVRLALEMALHEDEERRALSGELSVLHWAWRQEERLAAIADRLGLPEDLERQLEDLRARSLTPGS